MRRSPAARAPGPDHDGTSAVQTHMTNSRLTDPEILETRLSGAARAVRDPPRLGRGGRAHAAATGSSARSPSSSRCARTFSPTADASRREGIAGGGDAQAGRNWVERADGSVEMLSATASAEMPPGDRFVIETPGGGGFGRKGE